MGGLVPAFSGRRRKRCVQLGMRRFPVSGISDSKKIEGLKLLIILLPLLDESSNDLNRNPAVCSAYP
jgi:hypothetical protein